MSGLRQGTVVGQFGRHCLVQDAETQARCICHARGKKNQAVVGDVVSWLPSKDEGTVERVLPRRNVLYRQDELRTKTFAANLDTVLVWLAAEPVFSESQLTRALVACEDAGVKAVIVLNKLDLSDAAATALARLAPYRAMGYEVIGTCLKREKISQRNDPGFAQVRSLLQGRTTLVLGPSGSGKSSLVNALVPNAQVATNEISQALNSGKHTTTSTTWYELGDTPNAGALIDSPGFQEFGLHHITPDRLASLMPDIRKHVGQCRFYNCTHLHEPQCGVKAHVMDSEDVFEAIEAICPGEISVRRYDLYSTLMRDLLAAAAAH